MCLEGPQMPGTAFVEAIKPTPGLAIRPAEYDAGQAPQSATRDRPRGIRCTSHTTFPYYVLLTSYSSCLHPDVIPIHGSLRRHWTCRPPVRQAGDLDVKWVAQ